MLPNEVVDVLNRPASQELLARTIARLGYVAQDGTPRTIPIGFTWTGAEFVLCTAKNAAKVRSLKKNPAVALTIDTEAQPPQILLVRGSSTQEALDHVPDEFLQQAKGMPPEQAAAWEAEVRDLYRDGMVRIKITPSWAKLIDFETTLPSAVEELLRRKRG
ncbi:pyridoxamine 5'-phosphate oxidase family protein [Amycolatopsis solani]|uniref:pyridoxamine 5'-phosphate oxidase family protein n=1 Tax=Amycolatopsis solani TaxID=3028615 RepID=UPI0025AFC961|nr:pyridoxamine 5'-phosphate oxidase family protein [Amycolatopsis sp. MEP2-6]